ncbi:MAG: VCBS repeat-containing protein, partial [Myxococcota bacterium]|nr:VCBS repeat-containing protein [Myxococcota bacterium]
FSNETRLDPCEGCEPRAFTLHAWSDGVWKRANVPGLTEDESGESVELYVHDMDEDGYDDILATHITGLRVFFGAETSDERPTLHTDYRVPEFNKYLKEPELADLNNDGHLDLVLKSWGNKSTGSFELIYLQNDGSGRFSRVAGAVPQGLPLGNFGVVRAFDMDNDGDQDLAVSQIGPMLILENTGSCQGEVSCTPVFTARPDLVPDWLDAGGTFYGFSAPKCTPTSQIGADGYYRCSAMAIAVADVDGNGWDDLILTRRKGFADILLNNLGGTCEGVHCAGARFLSARFDLGIYGVLPITDMLGLGNFHGGEAYHPVVSPSGGPPNIIGVALADLKYAGPFEYLFQNEIVSAFPHATHCTTDEDCNGGGQCVGLPADPSFPAWRVCAVDGKQQVIGGWFTRREDAFPLRGGAKGAGESPYPAGKYVNTECSDVGDLNGDGYEDLVVMSGVGERLPTLDGSYMLTVEPACTAMAPISGASMLTGSCVIDGTCVQGTLGAGCTVDGDCDAGLNCEGTPGAEKCVSALDLTCVDMTCVPTAGTLGTQCTMDNDCSSGYQCVSTVCSTPSGVTYQWPTPCEYAVQCTSTSCITDNPTAYGLTRGASLFEDTEPECCTDIETSGKYYERPSCVTASGTARCQVRGYLMTNPHEFGVFAYIFDPSTGMYNQQQNMLGDAYVPGTEVKDCRLVDVDADGHLDLALAAYNTGFSSSYRKPWPELLTGAWAGERRRFYSHPSSVWLNPGWSVESGTTEAFTPGIFPEDGDKVYHLKAADIDGDGLVELLTTGSHRVNIYDDPQSSAN